MLDDPVTAHALLDEVVASNRAMWGMFAPEVTRARAWATLAAGHRADAVRALQAGADEAAEMGAGAIEALCRHDLARLGQAAEQAPRLRDLARRVDGPLVKAMADHAEALAVDDATALEASALAFAGLGFTVLATAAQQAAAASYERSGQRRSANAARRRSTGDPLTVLSDREREIALLAAEGRSSRDIGEALFVSVRTVDNHLRRVYEKLGVSGRAELTEVLRSN
jgi:DNA-binding NarL/FixJ family response regulator